MIEQLREEVEKKGITLVGICAFGISKDRQVDGFVLVPEAKVLALGTPKQRAAVAARFVKLTSLIMTQFLRKLLVSFDIQGVASELGKPIDEALREEMEHLRTVIIKGNEP